jgi:hypothetical protein
MLVVLPINAADTVRRYVRSICLISSGHFISFYDQRVKTNNSSHDEVRNPEAVCLVVALGVMAAGILSI